MKAPLAADGVCLFLSVLTAIFPGEAGLASFNAVKNNGSGGDYWSYKTKFQSNRHHGQTNTELFTGRIPFLLPNQQW